MPVEATPVCTTDTLRFLTVLPVYNEAKHITIVLDQVLRYASDVLVVDDGSRDASHALLSQRDDIDLIVHPTNRGYGAALQTAFEYATVHRYDVVVTIDCDGQHEPQRITQLVAACRNADIVSGSRYLRQRACTKNVPPERRRINELITAELNRSLGLELTDAFCGFKAYRTHCLAQLDLTETGYAMPLELWVAAAAKGCRIIEIPVPLIYLEEERSFGGSLDLGEVRLKYYREVLHRAMQRYMPGRSRGSSSTQADSQSCPCS